MDIEKGKLPPGWDVRLGLNGRLYYYSKQSQIVQLLPPPELWKCTHSLPYGWEMAVDYDTKNYYINHITQTVTYEDPRTEDDQSSSSEWNQIIPSETTSPQPRECLIERDSELGFGFIAGSEKPVIIRSVTPGGPSVGKLLPDDQIVKIGSENVMMADRERVIELIREKTDNVVLTVLQPNRSANSSFLNPAKKVCRTIDRPKVRFADDVIVNGQERTEGSSPLLLSPGVLRIELENSEVKSFQFVTETTAGDAVAALCDKLGFKDPNLFSLVLKPPYDGETPNEKTSKTSLRGSMSSDPQPVSSSSDSLLVAPWDCLSKVVNNPAFRHHSCHFRLEFMPTDFHKLARNDIEAFRYLYLQCVNDVVSGEVYMSDLTRDEILKLACIQMQELVLSSLPSTPSTVSERNQKNNGMNDNPAQRGLFRFPSVNNKLTLKYVEKEYGLRKFLPPSLVSTMQRDNPTGRNVRKAIQQNLKASTNASAFSLYPLSPGIPLSPTGQGGNKEVTLLQLRLQYLKILSPQHLFGGRYFSASIQALMESDITVLVGHHYGISQMINSKTKMVSVLAEFHHVTGFEVSACQAESSTTTVKIEFAEKQELLLSMEPQAAHNFAFMVAGYCRVYGNTNMVLTLPISENTTAPMYFGPHKVKPSTWSYPPALQFQPNRDSVADVSLPLDFSSPSYFYCDFSEPITPAVLSQETPILAHKQRNGHHRPHTPPPAKMSEVEYENDDAGHFAKIKHEDSDTNNNTSLVSNTADVTYEEIAINDQSTSESPVSSMSAGQFSDLSSPNSPQLGAGQQNDDVDGMDTLDGYLVPTPPSQRLNRATMDEKRENDNSSESEGDWMDLMKALKNEGSTKRAESNKISDVLPLSSNSSGGEKEMEKDVRRIIVPPPPSYPPPKIERRESAKRERVDISKATSAVSSAQEVKTRSCSLRSQNSDNSETYRNHRMSSFKPSEEELKVFSLTRNDVIGLDFAGSRSPTSTASSPEKEKRFDELDDVKDPMTRQKLQETEDLIQYFRQRREEVESRDKISSHSPDASQEFETDAPIIVPDIAAGNKRLRKAEKAAIKNRKSWAGNESPVLGKFDPDSEHPMSMSNPDLSITPSQKKKNKSLLRRIFGERKTRSHSMYETSGSNSFDTAYGGRKRRRFWKFRLRRAFTWSSTKKSNRKSVIPTSHGSSPPKSRSFLLRPFAKKTKSHGVLVISEPCDEVRGVDLLPSGKYTVAGTMFQVNGDVKDSEVVTVDNGSKRGSSDDITAQRNESTTGETSNEEIVVDSSDKTEGFEVNLRENSTRENTRPMSFSTFQQAIQDGNDADAHIDSDRRNSIQDGVDQQPSPCELSLTESSEHLQQLRDATARIDVLVEERSSTLPPCVMLEDQETLKSEKYQPKKPMRNLLHTDSPILSRDIAQKSASLPVNSSLSNKPNATSTPINVTVTKKYSHKRPAPPPPIQLARPVTAGENDIKSSSEVLSDDDVFSEPECLSEHSLMTEIFSCLQHSTVGNNERSTDPTRSVKNDVTSGSESALPYDENYVMPGLKSGNAENENVESENDFEEKRRKAMYEMFYDEMIAENSSLTLKKDDTTSNEGDDVTYDDVMIDDVGSDDSQDNEDKQDSYDVIYDDVPHADESDVTDEFDSDDSQSKGSKHASYDVTSDDVTQYNDTESDEVTLKSYSENLHDNDFATQVTSCSSNDSDVTDRSTSVSDSPISSPDYQNLHSQSGSLQNKSPGSAYFSYRHLISPLGYDKARPNALRKKPPLPPKPIFH